MPKGTPNPTPRNIEDVARENIVGLFLQALDAAKTDTANGFASAAEAFDEAADTCRTAEQDLIRRALPVFHVGDEVRLTRDGAVPAWPEIKRGATLIVQAAALPPFKVGDRVRRNGLDQRGFHEEGELGIVRSINEDGDIHVQYEGRRGTKYCRPDGILSPRNTWEALELVPEVSAVQTEQPFGLTLGPIAAFLLKGIRR